MKDNNSNFIHEFALKDKMIQEAFKDNFGI